MAALPLARSPSYPRPVLRSFAAAVLFRLVPRSSPFLCALGRWAVEDFGPLNHPRVKARPPGHAVATECCDGLRSCDEIPPRPAATPAICGSQQTLRPRETPGWRLLITRFGVRVPGGVRRKRRSAPSLRGCRRSWASPWHEPSRRGRAPTRPDHPKRDGRPDALIGEREVIG